MAGFASGDSSFNIKVSHSSSNLLNKRVQLRFAIGLNIREEGLIKHLSSYFDLTNTEGNIYFKSNAAVFETVKFSDIINKIIPFFEKYPIQGKKSLDFISFKEAATIVKNKDHLNLEGLKQILDIKARMNK
jgi:hypothetical protein